MTVWIARTDPGASQLRQLLADAGISAIVKPVVRIEKTQSSLPAGAFTIAIFVSSHAAILGQQLLPPISDWYAIGAATAQTLIRKHVQHPGSTKENSEGLLELAGLQTGVGQSVLIVCGEGGRPYLQQTLQLRGFEVARFEVYRRTPEVISEVPRVEIIVVGSVQAMELVAKIWFTGGGSDQVTVVVPSKRVAEIGCSLGFKNVHNSAGAAIEETNKWVIKLAQGYD